MKPRNGARRVDRLSARERQIVKLIAEGLTTKQIAARLRISEHTVDMHRSNVFKKLDFERSTALVRWAVEAGIA